MVFLGAPELKTEAIKDNMLQLEQEHVWDDRLEELTLFLAYDTPPCPGETPKPTPWRPHLPNWQHDEVNVREVGGEPEVEAAPLGHRGLVEVGEGQLVAEVAHQLGPAETPSHALVVIRESGEGREGPEVLIGP